MKRVNPASLMARLTYVFGSAYLGWNVGNEVAGRLGAVVGAIVACLAPLVALWLLMTFLLARAVRAARRATEAELHECVATAGDGRIPANVAFAELRIRGAIEIGDLQSLCRWLREPDAGRATLAAAAIRSALPEVQGALEEWESAASPAQREAAAARVLEAGRALRSLEVSHEDAARLPPTGMD